MYRPLNYFLKIRRLSARFDLLGQIFAMLAVGQIQTVYEVKSRLEANIKKAIEEILSEPESSSTTEK